MGNSVRADGLSLTPEGKVRTVFHPEGVSEKELFFNEEKVAALIVEYQRGKEERVWQEIVLESLSAIEALIKHYRFHQYDEVEAIRGDCIIKLRRIIEVYDPARGRAFSHIFWSLKNFLISFARNSRRRSETFSGLEEFGDTLAASTLYGLELSEHFKTRVLRIETRFSLPIEKEAIRFLIVYFLLEGLGNARPRLLPFLCGHYGFPRGEAELLYAYASVLLRGALFEEYPTQLGFDFEELRHSRKGKRFFEIARIVGRENFLKLIYIFGGVTVRLPEKGEEARLKAAARFLASLGTVSKEPPLKRGEAEETLLSGALKGFDRTGPLFEET
jgi:hypothetical protein